MKTNKSDEDSIKEAIKKKIKDKIKKELLEEIYNELKLEEDELTSEISSLISDKPSPKSVEPEIILPKAPMDNIKITITVKAILKIASHSLKYAHSKIPKYKWVEVIGLLAGKVKKNVLNIKDAYPMGHGTAIHAEIKDYKNYVRAFNDIKASAQIICGWYHSHPSYGCFMSPEDISTQARYQKLWDKAVALVIDPYKIDGTSLGFEIFRADLKTNKWFRIPFRVEGSLDIKMLPEILDFMSPIIEGKAAFLEYDEQ
ncbi:MAG: hypothetical protein ACFFAN_02655 [Promethearchaeota archaeon]